MTTKKEKQTDKEMTSENWEIFKRAESRYIRHVVRLHPIEALAMVNVGLDYIAHFRGPEKAAKVAGLIVKKIIRCRSN